MSNSHSGIITDPRFASLHHDPVSIKTDIMYIEIWDSRNISI